jgi:hypothetical protein
LHFFKSRTRQSQRVHAADLILWPLSWRRSAASLTFLRLLLKDLHFEASLTLDVGPCHACARPSSDAYAPKSARTSPSIKYSSSVSQPRVLMTLAGLLPTGSTAWLFSALCTVQYYIGFDIIPDLLCHGLSALSKSPYYRPQRSSQPHSLELSVVSMHQPWNCGFGRRTSPIPASRDSSCFFRRSGHKGP